MNPAASAAGALLLSLSHTCLQQVMKSLLTLERLILTLKQLPLKKDTGGLEKAPQKVDGNMLHGFLHVCICATALEPHL